MNFIYSIFAQNDDEMEIDEGNKFLDEENEKSDSDILLTDELNNEESSDEDLNLQ